MSPLVRFILFSTVFVKGGSFLSLPFLSIYLQKNFAATPAVTGLIVGLNPTAGLLMGFMGGYLSDLFGRKHVLLIATIFCALSYFIFSHSTAIWHFAVGSLLLGSSTGALQTSLRALLSDLTPIDVRPRAFRLQYFAINVGASVGPLVGAIILMRDFSLAFNITGSLYLLFFISFLFFDKFTHNPVIEETKVKARFNDCIRILGRDTAFLLFVLGSLLLSVTYSQIETFVPQYLRNISGDQGIRTFSWLLAANSITVMLGLYPATLAAKKMGVVGAITWGQVLMSIGFAAMAFVGASPIGLIACMIFLTIGEVLAFSNWGIVIDSFAKPGLKGAYFGASGFFMIGNSIGPALGGYMYQNAGSYFTFNALGLLSLAGTLFYFKGQRIREENRTAQQTEFSPELT
ncbi:MAG: MFS transporter [Bdellovibrionota bacterium]